MITNKAYLLGRSKYARPQAVLFANNPGTIVDGYYVPNGLEFGAKTPSNATPEDLNEFMILSDDNRSELSFQSERIENRQRTINGRMRSYFISDKLQLRLSWNNLPSRSFATKPDFAAETDVTEEVNGSTVSVSQGKSVYSGNNLFEYTTDGGAGGAELLNWYNTHTGSFWVYLAYDNYPQFGNEESSYQNLNKYNEIIEVFFSDFNYSVVKRGGTNFDLWNITLSLEEA
jgi:hypothetical protein